MDFESLNFSVGLDKNGTPIWFIDIEEFGNKFKFTQFLNNGNMVGYTIISAQYEGGKGFEIDLNGNIVFEIPAHVNSLHHQIIKTTHDTYFIISVKKKWFITKIIFKQIHSLTQEGGMAITYLLSEGLIVDIPVRNGFRPFTYSSP